MLGELWGEWGATYFFSAIHSIHDFLSGIWFGLVGTTIVATIALHNMHLLVEASHHLCHLMGKETLDYGFCMDFAFKNVQGTEPIT